MPSPSETASTRVPAAQPVGPTSETLLVCIGPSPASARVIRTSHMMARSLNARWIAANVETLSAHGLGQVEGHQLMENLDLARGLGAEVATLSGQDVAEVIITYARSRGVTRIVIGKSGGSALRLLFRQTIVDRLLRLGADIDIYVIQSSGGRERSFGRMRWRPGSRWGYLGAVGTVAVACLIALGLQRAGLSEANRAVVFIPAVVAAAILWGLGPGVLAAVASVLTFDFFFVPPHFTLAVQDIQWVVTLVVLAAVALLVGTLAARLRSQAETARARERRLEALYRLTRGLSGASGIDRLVGVAEAEVGEAFGGPSTIHLPCGGGQPAEARAHQGPVIDTLGPDREAESWALEHGESAGLGTGTFPQAAAIHVPMITAHGPIGVLSVEAPREVLVSPENQRLLETTATQIGIAIERDALEETTRRAVLEAEAERMRSTLLSSVSHDLRTPLAVISGSASTLLRLGEGGNRETRTALLSEVCEESERLTRLVENLLAMTRLDSAVIRVNKQWFPLEDVVGSALGRLRRKSQGREIRKHWQSDLPLVLLDGVLIEQALFNLLENAVNYSPPDTVIDLSVSSTPEEMTVSVADRGPGLREDELTAVFDKLYRGEAARQSARGAGLGLTIARAVVHAHGGNIWAENRPEGGAIFSFTLPMQPPPAGMEADMEMQEEQ
jgi:two-component system, OmpR family, sensor histidine kinase KdpD